MLQACVLFEEDAHLEFTCDCGDLDPEIFVRPPGLDVEVKVEPMKICLNESRNVQHQS
jgi:hypothetical protein